MPAAGLALLDGQRRWSWADLSERAARRGRCLRRQGLVAGDLVVCPADLAGADWLVMQQALAGLGAAWLPLAADLDPARRRALIEVSGADWLWTLDAHGDADAGTLRPSGVRATAARHANRHGEHAGNGTAASARQLALVVATSGSSGPPKAVLLTRANLDASCTSVNTVLGLQSDGLWLCCLPRQHIGGLAIGYRCAAAGAALLVHRQFDAAAVLADLWRQPVTHLSLVPPMLARLLDQPGAPPPWLRAVLVGGQALHPGLARRARAAGWPLAVSYGMTETCSMIAWQRLDAGARAGADQDDEDSLPALRLLPGVELAAADCDSPAPPPPLRVRGPMVMGGYANPARGLGLGLDAAGWLTSADLGCLDAAGHLRVLGRADTCVVIGGVNVLPAAVERELERAPGVAVAVVVGVPEPVWGHRLVAVYHGVANPGQLDAWCRAHLPKARRPRGFIQLAELPLLASGKVDRQRVLDIARHAPAAAARARPEVR